jgi:hypothetical protein
MLIPFRDEAETNAWNEMHLVFWKYELSAVQVLGIANYLEYTTRLLISKTESDHNKAERIEKWIDGITISRASKAQNIDPPSKECRATTKAIAIIIFRKHNLIPDAIDTEKEGLLLRYDNAINHRNMFIEVTKDLTTNAVVEENSVILSAPKNILLTNDDIKQIIEVWTEP